LAERVRQKSCVTAAAGHDEKLKKIPQHRAKDEKKKYERHLYPNQKAQTRARTRPGSTGTSSHRDDQEGPNARTSGFRHLVLKRFTETKGRGNGGASKGKNRIRSSLRPGIFPSHRH